MSSETELKKVMLCMKCYEVIKNEKLNEKECEEWNESEEWSEE